MKNVEYASPQLYEAYSTDICKSLFISLAENGYPAHLAALMGPIWFEKHVHSHNKLSFRTMMATFPKSLLPFAAAAVGNIALFQTFTTHGFDYHEVALPFRGALGAVAATGHIAMAEHLLDNLIDKTNLAHSRYWRSCHVSSAIKIAAATSNPEVAEKIYEYVRHTPKPDIKYGIRLRGSEILRKCVEYNEARILECVLSLGVICATRTEPERCLFTSGDGSLLRHAIKHGHVDPNCCMTGKSRGAYTSPLEVALDNDRRDLFRILLECGADIDGTSNTAGVTLLWHAANRGDMDCAKFLLSHGANPRSREGWREPLQVAKERGVKEIIDLLVNA
jgi:hypothetical protein